MQNENASESTAESTSPLISWLSRLERKVEELEKAVAEGNIEQLTKSLATCDTYLKKLYARAKEHVFHTAEGPQVVRDLAKLKVRIERVRKNIARNHPAIPWYSSGLREIYVQEQFV
jgi:hypothetical protein